MHGMTATQSDAVPDRALRVCVDDERLESAARERRAEIHRRGRFADAALLADDREYFTHALLELPRGVGGALTRGELIQRLLRVTHPAVRLGALGWVREKGVQVTLRSSEIAALQQEVREAVMCTRELRIELEGTAIGAHGIVELARLREGDRHVLEDARIVGLIAQRQAIRCQRRIEVT